VIQKRGKHTKVTSVQNESGNGIEAIGFDRRGNITLFDVKRHRLVAKPELSKLQRPDLTAWAKNVLEDVANKRGPHVNATAEQVANAKEFLNALKAGKKIHRVVVNVDNALTEFPNVSIYRYNKGKRPLLTRWPARSSIIGKMKFNYRKLVQDYRAWVDRETGDDPKYAPPELAEIAKLLTTASSDADCRLLGGNLSYLANWYGRHGVYRIGQADPEGWSDLSNSTLNDYGGDANRWMKKDMVQYERDIR
jgi:hypothetical protein